MFYAIITAETPNLFLWDYNNWVSLFFDVLISLVIGLGWIGRRENFPWLRNRFQGWL